VKTAAVQLAKPAINGLRNKVDLIEFSKAVSGVIN
jgi:hypothetical protein